SQYTKWPSSYYDLLRNNFFFGGLRTIRKNLYNLVIIIDPSQIDTLYELMKNIEAYFVHELSIRIGLLFVTNNEYIVLIKSKDVKQTFSKIAKYSGNLSSIFYENNPFENECHEMNLYFEQSEYNFKIQQQVYYGQLRDSNDIIEILNTKPNVVKRLNQRIFGQTPSMPTIYVDLSMINGQTKDLLDSKKFQTLSVREQADVIMASMIYLGKKDELGQPLYLITLWIACDLDRPDERQLFLNALTYLKKSRLGTHPITKAVYTTIRLLSYPIAHTFIFKLFKDESIIEDLIFKRKSCQTVEHEIATFDDNIFQSHSIFIEQTLHLPRGSRSFLVNGRILGALNENEQYTANDFILLDKHLSTTMNDRLICIVSKLELSNDPSQLSDLLMRISSIISQNNKSSSPITRKQIPHISSTSKAVLNLPAKQINEPAFLIEAILDPA
ncbi:unnamed protein product, partial [Rotaria sordida]